MAGQVHVNDNNIPDMYMSIKTMWAWAYYN